MRMKFNPASFPTRNIRFYSEPPLVPAEKPRSVGQSALPSSLFRLGYRGPVSRDGNFKNP